MRKQNLQSPVETSVAKLTAEVRSLRAENAKLKADATVRRGPPLPSRLSPHRLQMQQRLRRLSSVDELTDTLAEHGERETTRVLLVAVAVAAVLLAFAMHAFVVCIPLTYGVGGWLLYGPTAGWKFFQPGVGGARFVALNGMGWSLYAFSVITSLCNLYRYEPVLSTLSWSTGLLAYGLMVAALLTYRNGNMIRPLTDSRILSVGLELPPDATVRARCCTVRTRCCGHAALCHPTSNAMADKIFADEMEDLIRDSQTPIDFFWLFIGLQSCVCAAATFLNWCAFIQSTSENIVWRMLANVMSLCIFSCSLFVTYSIGGHWKYFDEGFRFWQPGKGGAQFVWRQVVGWSTFGLTIVISVVVFYSHMCAILAISTDPINDLWMPVAGIGGLISQIFITSSLFHFDSSPIQRDRTQRMPHRRSCAWDILVRSKFLGLNILFSEFGRDLDSACRAITIRGPEAYREGEKRWAEAVKKMPRTGDQYLVVGCGFVGRTIVEKLLERGETHIRVFDISQHNPFEKEHCVEFVRGDVTNDQDIGAACKGTCHLKSTVARPEEHGSTAPTCDCRVCACTHRCRHSVRDFCDHKIYGSAATSGRTVVSD